MRILKSVLTSLGTSILCLVVSMSLITTAYALSPGSIGPWTTSANSLPQNITASAATTYNNYVYNVGGFNGNSINAVTYAPLNSDGSVGAWLAASALPQSLDGVSTVAYNGYLYAIGGYDTGGNVWTDAVYYAPINNDGSLGGWTLNGNLLPSVLAWSTISINNGYIYITGGYTGIYHSSVYYAPINPNGTIGPWVTSPHSLPQTIAFATSVVNNGYLYELGGTDSGTETAAIYYAPLNSDGSVGAWTTNATPLPQAISDTEAVTSAGYVYVLGGEVSGFESAPIYYAQFNSDGSVGAWTTNATPLPQALMDATTVINNGYVYEMGGTGNLGSVNTVYNAQITPIPKVSSGSNGTSSTTSSTTSDKALDPPDTGFGAPSNTNLWLILGIYGSASASLFGIAIACNKVYRPKSKQPN